MRPDLSSPIPGRGGWWASQRIRLALLLSCAAALGLWLAAARTGALRPSPGPACPFEGAPHVVEVSAAELSGLRASVARAMPDRIGRLYEEGIAEGADAWSDDSPAAPPLSPTAPRSAGYEMRWWAPNGDDVVADVLVFAGPRQANSFIARAASARCRPSGSQAAARWPTGGHNLRWVNPDGFAQADVMFTRGSRVYRVAVVQPGQAGRTPTPADRRRAFRAVDLLACLLPSAACQIAGEYLPA